MAIKNEDVFYIRTLERLVIVYVVYSAMYLGYILGAKHIALSINQLEAVAGFNQVLALLIMGFILKSIKKRCKNAS